MAIFKCKMCGGTLEIGNDQSVATCEYCGTMQTLPKLDDDRRANFYDRANHFRRNNEFDKAMGIYEQILNENSTDAEAYWSLVLCRYGIEYVEDPSSHKRIPTVNRAQFTSIFEDDNYKSALQYADISQREIYESEAKAINEIQKKILAISQKEDPFDVFICYKETDSNGRRTPDSVLANDLYHQLTQEGFKVFFSRITLEDKLGCAYEPYIFAALNSSKIMVVLGTKPEFFNAVWVKNEWSRFLGLIKNGADKMLIPAYKDMDPYDLPEEFSHLQAQDMSKLGFMQDLIRGIKKIINIDEQKQTVVQETPVAYNTTSLMKRAFMFLEDGNWQSADEYCEKVLDIEPENYLAYIAKLMVEVKVRNREQFKDCKQPFDNRINYQKAFRFADEEVKNELKGYIEYINVRNENTRLESIYNKAKSDMVKAYSVAEFEKVAQMFRTIDDYKDSASLAEKCMEDSKIAIENEKKDRILAMGRNRMRANSVADCEEAIRLFESISGWKNADALILVCKKKIEKEVERERKEASIREEKRLREKRTRMVKLGLVIALVAISIFTLLWLKVISPAVEYNTAMTLIEEKNYDDAYKILQKLGDYKDSAEKLVEIRLDKNTESLKNCDVGQYVKFGAYEQDYDASDGKEEIEWLVLEKEDSRVLLISKYALECMEYDSYAGNTYVTWDTCDLREFLNGTFVNQAFSDSEAAIIPTVRVTADATPECDIDPGIDTDDKVFLLSVDEANKYFHSDIDRQCEATDYAKKRGARSSSVNDNCWWWLRTISGEEKVYATGVNDDGIIGENTTDFKWDEHYTSVEIEIEADDGAVRPAMWIDISELE